MAALKGCLEESAPGASWIHVDGGMFDFIFSTRFYRRLDAF